jgi:hypothetical protein
MTPATLSGDEGEGLAANGAAGGRLIDPREEFEDE